MVKMQRTQKRNNSTQRVISLFVLILSIIGLSFSTNKIYEFYRLNEEQKTLQAKKNELIEENTELQGLLDEENYNIITYKDDYCYNSNTKQAYKCKN